MSGASSEAPHRQSEGRSAVDAWPDELFILGGNTVAWWNEQMAQFIQNRPDVELPPSAVAQFDRLLPELRTLFPTMDFNSMEGVYDAIGFIFCVASWDRMPAGQKLIQAIVHVLVERFEEKTP
jgi:hypothetical protein